MSYFAWSAKKLINKPQESAIILSGNTFSFEGVLNLEYLIIHHNFGWSSLHTSCGEKILPKQMEENAKIGTKKGFTY